MIFLLEPLASLTKILRVVKRVAKLIGFQSFVFLILQSLYPSPEAFHYDGKTWFYLWNTSCPWLTSDIRRRQSKFSFLITTPFSFNTYHCERSLGFSSLWKFQLASFFFQTCTYFMYTLSIIPLLLAFKTVLFKSIFKRICHMYYNIILGYRL